MTEVDANKVINELAGKIGVLEAENAILKTQLNEQESGENNGKQDTKS